MRLLAFSFSGFKLNEDATNLLLSKEHMAPKKSQGNSNAVVARKRAQVPVACELCRQKKTKCDALRPCSLCISRQTPCQYDTQLGETHARATKRKLDEISQACEEYEKLFELLKTRDEQDTAEIVRRIRLGHSPESILHFVQTRDAALVLPDPHRIALEMFLVNLAHSTGSLQDVVRLAMDSTTLVQLPSPEDFRVLCNRIVYLPFLDALLRRSSGQVHRDLPASPRAITRSPLIDDQTESDQQQETLDGDMYRDQYPPHCVPAAPWTKITTSDEAVSHLVSVFLTWINPTWRFVEADLFLLVQLQSEHDIAFSQGEDRITRGQQFHNEAIRLWMLEENRPTLTNIQALCVLSLESNYRAKDRLGLTLVPIAAQLDKVVPKNSDAKRCAAQGVLEKDYLRARLSAHWMVECTDIHMRIAYMSGAKAEPRRSDMPSIEEVFTDTPEIWTGYPLTNSAVPYRPTLYLLERCKLAEIFQEIHSLLLARGEQRNETIRTFASAVENLSGRMQHWLARLTRELQYRWPMSIDVWELHASYHTVLMILHITARTRLHSREESTEPQLSPEDLILGKQLAKENLSKAIPVAHRSAQTLREYRERYGLKITPAWLIVMPAIAANVLLLDPELANPTLTTSASSGDSDDSIRASHSAFDELFRCLLGTGVQVMIARGIARMTYHTTLKQRITLSRLTWNILQIMSDTAWRPSDVSLVNSTFPNYGTIKGHEDNERLTELLSKWENINID
ncbi:hypothetical protein Q7P37_010108 [Cladosporium fusiforme]